MTHPTTVPTVPTVELSACREYLQPADCDHPDCTDPDHPHCPDVWPDEWSEWIEPDPGSAYVAGWYTEPPDGPDPFGQDERITRTVGIYTAAEVIRDWTGRVWEMTDGTTRYEGSWSTDDYRTGRESLDTLFVDGPGESAALALALEMG